MKADTGPIGGDLSHEFIVLADTGESEVFTHRELMNLAPPPADIDFDGDLEPVFSAWTTPYAATDEMHDPAAFEAIPETDRLSARGIEVGHIFYFGTKYSSAMQAQVETPDGPKPLEMGSYGIGVSRLVGALIEAYHDDDGCKWPLSVAPFEVGIVNLKAGDQDTDAACHALYSALGSEGVDVLYDDTADRAGEKFARMDLIGLPFIVTIGPRGLKEGQVELKTRASGAKEEVPLEGVAALLAERVRMGLAADAS